MSRPGRTLMVARLPIDLLDALDAEARRRGISTEQLVDDLLVTTLPVVLAEAAEAHLRRSLALAAKDGSPRAVHSRASQTSGLTSHVQSNTA